jgi:hypothetical protein
MFNGLLNININILSIFSEYLLVRISIFAIAAFKENGLQSSHVLFTKGGEESIKGVGFLVHTKIKHCMLENEGIISRLASLTLKINSKYQLHVIQVYAPTSSHDDDL